VFAPPVCFRFNDSWLSFLQVKQTDKSSFKKKRSWLLSDLKAVDGKDIDGDTHEFDLQFDKCYKWFAISLQERQNFLILLWKVRKPLAPHGF
jgi:hypothetical protein